MKSARPTLHIDIETFSEVDLAKEGVYKYAADPSFRVLLICYAWDNEPVHCIDMEAEDCPAWLFEALQNPNIIKCAHNATFERVCLSEHFALPQKLDASQWECSMIQCARCGLPLSLAQAGAVLGLEQQKMKEGKDLIKLFCSPHESKGGLFQNGHRALPSDFPAEWETFKAYCIRDVEVEREIARRLSWMEVPEFEKALYKVDQDINDRGVLVDTVMASEADRMQALSEARLGREFMAITGCTSVKSGPQLKAWLESRGLSLDKVDKTAISDLLSDPKVAEDKSLIRALKLRSQLTKTSCSKYSAMLRVAGTDGRARGLTQFYGTATGRWAGRLVQLQNLPQNHIDIESLTAARAAVRAGDIDTIDLVFGNVPDTLSQLIRTAFVPSKGKVFAVCDFSAIEARVLAWLAGEDWVLEVFRSGGDIYCTTASQMFKVPVEKHGRNAHLRQRSKVAVLALGYGGGVGALDLMGGQRLGMTKQEEADTVRMWRAANPNITELWYRFEDAAVAAVSMGRSITVAGCLFSTHDNVLTVGLPSGRTICYWDAQLTTNRFGGRSIKYKRLNQETHKWEYSETYGGKLTENITQAVARDCLAEKMRMTEAAGIPIVFHVHDELVTEVDGEEGLKRLQDIFAEPIIWARGLPLKGAGYTGNFYYKD